MACEYCTDDDGSALYPIYGMGPHRHDMTNGWIGSTRAIPAEDWPDNFVPDPDPEWSNHGTWYCPRCRDGMPAKEAQ